MKWIQAKEILLNTQHIVVIHVCGMLSMWAIRADGVAAKREGDGQWTLAKYNTRAQAKLAFDAISEWLADKDARGVYVV